MPLSNWKQAIVVAALGLVAAAPAHAIFKCVGADGKVTYSDVACSGSVRHHTLDSGYMEYDSRDIQRQERLRQNREARKENDRLRQQARNEYRNAIEDADKKDHQRKCKFYKSWRDDNAEERSQGYNGAKDRDLKWQERYVQNGMKDNNCKEFE